MQEIWYKGVHSSDQQGRERVKREYGAARHSFTRLIALLESKIKETVPKDYDKASWPYFQADSIGYNRALTEVLNLIKEPD